jgi:hypothetical protein
MSEKRLGSNEGLAVTDSVIVPTIVKKSQHKVQVCLKKTKRTKVELLENTKSQKCILAHKTFNGVCALLVHKG